MAPNRVQVTIGADDEATVVLKKVQLELSRLGLAADKADRKVGGVTRGGAQNVGRFTTAVSGASQALGALGLAISAASLVAFAKSAVDAADNLNDLRAKTGINAQTLQALGLVADQSGSSVEDLSGIVARLSKALVELRQGDKTTVATFKALGLSAKDLANATPDEALTRVAKALVQVSDPANKSTIAMRLLGRSGAEVLPLLEALANDAVPKARAELEKFGALISDDTIQAADEFNDQLALIKTVSKGLFANAIGDILKTTAAIRELNDATGDLVASVPGVREFGTAVEWVWDKLRSMSGNPLNPFSMIATQVENVVTRVRAVRRALAGVQSFEFRDVAGGASSARQGISGDIPDVTKTTALENAKLAAERAASQRTLAARLQALAVMEAADRAAYDRGLESLDQFYRNRVQRIRDGVAAEVTALQAERAALAASPVAADDPAAAVNRQRELADLAAKIATAKAKGAADEVAAGREREQMARDLEDKQLAAEAELSRLRGLGIEQAREATRQWLREYEETLRKAGKSAEEIGQRVGEAWSLRTDVDQFGDASDRMREALAALETDRAAIRQRAAQGQISEADGERQILALERDRLPTLRSIQTAMADIAARIGDPALIESARQLGVELGTVGVQVRASDLALKNIGTTIREGMTADLEQFLGSTINQVDSLGEALRSLALSVLGSVQQALAKIIALRVMEAVFDRGKDATGTATQTAAAAAQGAAAAQTTAAAGALGTAAAGVGAGAAATTGAAGALSAAGSVVMAAAGAMSAAAAALAAAGAAQAAFSIGAGFAGLGMFGFASGGYIAGPGTGTSDSIPAWLSNGEYVIRAAAVDKYGVAFLNAINSGGLSRSASVPRVNRFASGGLVSVAALAASGEGPGGVVELRLRDEMLEARVLDTLESKAGQRIQVKNAAKNSRAMGGALKR